MVEEGNVGRGKEEQAGVTSVTPRMASGGPMATSLQKEAALERLVGRGGKWDKMRGIKAKNNSAY